MTYESNVREQLGEDPDTRTGDDDSDDIEYQPHNRNGEEQPNEA